MVAVRPAAVHYAFDGTLVTPSPDVSAGCSRRSVEMPPGHSHPGSSESQEREKRRAHKSTVDATKDKVNEDERKVS